jgi:uncharacterized protein
MKMFSGLHVDPFNLSPDQIRIDDIAWALSNICRYGGHCHRNYSVAEHTLLVAGLLPPHKKLYALLHDAPEAYLGDIPTPLKRRMPQFKELETKVARVVAEAFNIDPDEFLSEIETGDVKQADLMALKYEQSFLWKDSLLQYDRQATSAKKLYVALWDQTPHVVGHPAHPFFVTCY